MNKKLITLILAASIVTASAIAEPLFTRAAAVSAVKQKVAMNNLASCTTFANGSFKTTTYQCCSPSAATSGAPKTAWYPTTAVAPTCPSAKNNVAYAAISSCGPKTPVQVVSASSTKTSYLPENSATANCLLEATA